VTPNLHFTAFRLYSLDLEAVAGLAGLVAAAKTTRAAVQTTPATLGEDVATIKTSLTAEPTVVGAFRINVAP
jgi:hypothetical protein